MFVVPFAVVSVAFADAPACEKATTTSQLRTQITEAFGAFAENDGPGFEAAAAKVEATRGCLGEFLLPADAAELHRFQGLRSFYRQEPDYAIQSFQAALAIQSGFNLPTSVAPEPGPLWTMYERAKGRPAPATVALGLKGYSVFVDGKLATEHPSMLPYFVQFQAPDGSVHGTSYVAAGAEPTPPAGLAPVAVATPVVVPPQSGEPAVLPSPHRTRFGFDLGFPSALRLEVAGKKRLDYGLRFVIAYGVGIEPYLDVRAGERWDVEIGVGGVGGPGFGVGFFRAALQYDPPSPFHLNVGLVAITSDVVPAVPELSIGWLW